MTSSTLEKCFVPFKQRFITVFYYKNQKRNANVTEEMIIGKTEESSRELKLYFIEQSIELNTLIQSDAYIYASNPSTSN